MKTYDIEAEWTASDLALLQGAEDGGGSTSCGCPRALLSIRLSVLTEDTTSPVRQELDLRLLARDKGYRVVGVASDLNVSATKVPPWKRKELGEWLNKRSPEFDALLFWKLDRFIRRMSDLLHHDRVVPAVRKEPGLEERLDRPESTVGRMMVTLIGGIAEIEAANTSTASASLWDYTRTQGRMVLGKPAYGYVTTKANGRPSLAIEPERTQGRLRWARRMALRECRPGACLSASSAPVSCPKGSPRRLSSVASATRHSWVTEWRRTRTRVCAAPS